MEDVITFRHRMVEGLLVPGWVIDRFLELRRQNCPELPLSIVEEIFLLHRAAYLEHNQEFHADTLINALDYREKGILNDN